MQVYGRKPQVRLSGSFPLEVRCSIQLSYGREWVIGLFSSIGERWMCRRVFDDTRFRNGGVPTGQTAPESLASTVRSSKPCEDVPLLALATGQGIPRHTLSTVVIAFGTGKEISLTLLIRSHVENLWQDNL